MVHIVRTVCITAIVKIVVEELRKVVLTFKFCISVNIANAKAILR